MLTLATQDQAERRETTSRAIGGPISGLVDQTPSTLMLKMGVKKMIEVSLSFSCLHHNANSISKEMGQKI